MPDMIPMNASHSVRGKMYIPEWMGEACLTDWK
jgi:hypothetical protein